MKILQVVQKPQRRGAEVFASQLSEWLRNAGNEVRTFYLYPCRESNSLQLLEKDSTGQSTENHFFEKIPGWNPLLLKQLSKVAKEFNPDVVQLNAARTVKYGALLKQIHPGKNWVMIYRNIGDPGMWLQGNIRTLLYRKLFIPNIDGIVAVSSATLNVLKTLYNGNHQITQIHRGVDPAKFQPTRSRNAVRQELNTPPDSPVVVFVGSLTPEKRVDLLLQIIQDAKSTIRNLMFWIIGDGTLRMELEKQAEKSGIADSVRFTGLQKDVASFVNAADLLALASETEGIPGVVLEAALLGIPSIAPGVGGVRECIVDGETGIVTAAGDVAALKTGIVYLIGNEERRKRMGENARTYIHDHFIMEKIAAKYLAFYSQVLRAKRDETGL